MGQVSSDGSTSQIHSVTHHCMIPYFHTHSLQTAPPKAQLFLSCEDYDSADLQTTEVLYIAVSCTNTIINYIFSMLFLMLCVFYSFAIIGMEVFGGEDSTVYPGCW